VSDSVSGPDPRSAINQLIDEGLIGMTRAARLMGTFRQGKPTHASTIARWALIGIKLPDGRVLKLESLRLNGRLCTSKEAVYRFVQSQNERATSVPPEAPTLSERTLAKKAASKQLDDLGIK
jgi:hypothetical protein